MNDFEIRRVPLQRLKTDYIILSPVVNFTESGYYIPPDVLLGGYKFSYPIIEKYFFETVLPGKMAKGELDQLGLPFHYFCELIAKDYYVLNSQPNYSYSYFMEDMIYAKLIPMKYKMSVVVSLGLDFSLEIGDKRMWEQLSQKLLVPLLLQYNLNIDKIVFIDDIIDYDNLIEKMDNAKLKYQITKGKYYSKDDMLNILRRYYQIRKF